MIGPIEDITREGLLFSAKTFLAATIALWIALEFDLPRPYWALATVYILAQPLAGAVTSKALYRFAGTIVGAAVAVLLVPNLVTAPELLCVGLAIWIGLCLFLSRLDRTPRSYGFMLAGYTAAIVGFPSVNAPEAIFETAVSRVEEIVVGIICTAVVSRSLFPAHVGPLIAARIQTWMENAGALARHVLLEEPDVARMREDQRRLAKDITDIAALTAQLPYDTSALRHASEEMRALQQRMTALLPILAGIGDRLHALHERDEVSEELRSLLAEIATWVESGGEGSELDAERPRASIASAAEGHARANADAEWRWPDLLGYSLLARMQDLADIWADCLALRRDLLEGKRRAGDRFRAAARYAGISGLHRDVTAATQSGLAAALAILLCCAFWIVTAWPDGAGAVLICAIFSSIFAALDNQVSMLRNATLQLALAVAIAFIYQFSVFPAIDGFPLLVLALSPLFLFFGALLATPRWNMFGLIMCLFTSLSLAVQSHLDLDLAVFVNSNVATLFGAMMAAAVISGIGTRIEASVNRLMAANWADLAELCDRPGAADTSSYVHKFVDRFSLFVQRVAAMPLDSGIDPETVMRELRVGVNIVDLQRFREALPAARRRAVAALLKALHGYFSARRPMQVDEGSALIRLSIDDAIAALADRPGRGGPDDLTCLYALVGIRCALLPNAPDFAPPVPVSPAECAP
jgi:uncharacterized membrane protein YccC